MKINKDNIHYLYFAVSTLLFYLFLDYHNILFYRPQSIHFMRQTDSLSFVVTYFNYGMNFLEPRVLSLKSIDGKAVGEFPILYYLAAILYKIFGEHEFFLRLINLTIVTVGLLYLYKLLVKLLSDVVYALSFTFLFFSSTVLIYYTNNFLPDPSAFGLTLIGWYFYYDFFENKSRTKSFVLSLILFTLAALIKVTYGLNLSAALLSLVIYEIFIYHKFSFRKLYPYLISFLFAFIIVLSWYYYVLRYNEINNVDSFLMNTLPIWSLNELQRNIIWDYIYYYWSPKYYFESFIHVIILLIIASLFLIKKSNKIVLTFTITTTIGSIIYFVLFFAQFKAHDYYFIGLIPAIIFLVINSFISIKNTFPKITRNIFFKIAIITLLLLSINYAQKKLTERYLTFDKYANIGTRLDNVNVYLDLIGIGKNEKVIVIHDVTPNGSLYFLDRRGWTISDTSTDKLNHIPSYIKSGASFLLITNKEYLQNPVIQKITTSKIGSYNDILIYSL